MSESPADKALNNKKESKKDVPLYKLKNQLKGHHPKQNSRGRRNARRFFKQ